MRVVLDAAGRVHAGLKLIATARAVPTLVAAPRALPSQDALKQAGAEIFASELADGRIALPELLEDLASRGVMNLLVEGGAAVASSFLAEDLVDRIALFESPVAIGRGHAVSRHVASPVAPGSVPSGFRLTGEQRFGDDRLRMFERID